MRKGVKSTFIPRFHQKLFILKINKLIEDGEQNILVGAIPRSGKSYIMAGTILDYIKEQKRINPVKKVKIILMTPAPNETFGEYGAIFNNYIEFDKLGISIDTYKGNVTSNQICSDKDKHCIIIISKQKLGWSAGSKSEKILAKDDNDEKTGKDEDEAEDEDEDGDSDIRRITARVNKLFGANPDIDIMFLDEAHFGMSTEKAQQIVKVLDSAVRDTVKIYVTATYNKPLQAYGVTANSKLTWDMNDIKIMQTLTVDSINNNHIRDQFGSDIYEASLEYFGDETGKSLIDKFKNDYAIFPKPYLITSIWDKDFLNAEKLKIGDTEFGWDMNKLFATKIDSDNFENEEQIKEMMRYYFGYPDKKDDYDKQSFYRARGILPRIRNICLNKCRTLQQQHKTTQLWFLPIGSGKIKNKTKALINLLLNTNEFKDVKQNYHFFIAVDIENKTKKGRTINGVTYMGNPHNIKTDIEKLEKEIKEGKHLQDNLIILAGNRLQLGISLRNVDIVTLWNSISSADAIFQMLFRSMTEVDVSPCKQNEYCDEKKFGFMVDMNPQRALTNVSLFSANISKKYDKDDTYKYRQITDLINIDEDVLYDKYGDDEKSRNEFVNDLFNKLYASWNINVENIKKIISKFSFDMTKLEALKGALKGINIEKGKKSQDEKDEDEKFDSGKKKEKMTPNKKGDKKGVKEKEINLIETAAELISEFISLLNIFTLYADKGAQCILTDTLKTNAQITLIDDIDVLKNSVYQDEETKDVFLKILNGRLSGNADEPYLENVIEDVLDAMDSSDDKLIINKIIMSQKKHYYTINEPDKLLEYIDTQLKPKEIERKENGEVFTPLYLVKEMLDKLDEAYIKEHGKSIFTEIGFKWLDPAVGIGNFPIILYQELMKGLSTQIPNDKERIKHILEQMIYSAELTPKNVFIYKKIFCGDKYKLNIYEGDTLQMDVMKVWGIDKFDVILGNPPYNKGGIRSHTGAQLLEGEKSETIWTKFIEKSFEWLKPDGFLAFINPLSWLKKSHSLHNEMLEKHIVWLKLWDNSQSKSMINADIPISLFVLENTLNTTTKNTEITSILKRRNLTTTSTEYLNPKYSIPLAFYSIFNKLVGFIETRNLQLEYKTKTVKNEHEIREVVNKKTKKSEKKNVSIEAIPLPKTYKLEDMWAVDTYTIKEGLMVKKATEQHPDANKRKLIIANKASFTGAFIDEGKMSLTGNHKFYILGDNLELLLKLLSFKISDMISHFTKYGQDFLEKEVYTYLPDIRKLGIADITEDEFYKLIGLTHQEINQINKEEPDEEEENDVQTPLKTVKDTASSPKKTAKSPSNSSVKSRTLYGSEVKHDSSNLDPPIKSKSNSQLSSKSNSVLSMSNFSSVRGEEEVKDDGWRGESPTKSKTKLPVKPTSKSKTCKRNPAKQSCKERDDEGPMDEECELSVKDRCVYKKSTKKKSSKGGGKRTTKKKKCLSKSRCNKN